MRSKLIVWLISLFLFVPLAFAEETRFFVDNKGIITDTSTELQWYVGPDRSTKWREANSWVKYLKVGEGGWRMPTLSELRGIYIEGSGKCNIAHMFKMSKCNVWSSKWRNRGTLGPLYFYFDYNKGYKRSSSDSTGGFAMRAFVVRSIK